MLRYYGASELIDGRAVRPAMLDSYIDTSLPEAKQVLLVVNRPFYWFDGANPAEAVAQTFSCHSAGNFTYFNVLECGRRQGGSDRVRP